MSEIPRPDKSGLGTGSAIPLVSLRGASIHRGDEAISVEGIETATPRQIGTCNDPEGHYPMSQTDKGGDKPRPYHGA